MAKIVLKCKNLYDKIKNEPDWELNDTGKEAFIIYKRGKKKKKYLEKTEDIKKDLQIMSIREVANKYNCSTRTVQLIKNGKY